MYPFPIQHPNQPIQYIYYPVYVPIHVPIVQQPLFAYTCPEDDAVINHLPEEVKALHQQIPSLLLNEVIARDLTHYYKNKKDNVPDNTAPRLEAYQPIHFLVCNENAQGYITRERVRALIDNEFTHFLGSKPIESYTEHSATASGFKNGRRYLITFFYHGLVNYLAPFDGNKRYLIDITTNQIVFKNRETNDLFYQPTTIIQEEQEVVDVGGVTAIMTAETIEDKAQLVDVTEITEDEEEETLRILETITDNDSNKSESESEEDEDEDDENDNDVDEEEEEEAKELKQTIITQPKQTKPAPASGPRFRKRQKHQEKKAETPIVKEEAKPIEKKSTPTPSYFATARTYFFGDKNKSADARKRYVAELKSQRGINPPTQLSATNTTTEKQNTISGLYIHLVLEMKGVMISVETAPDKRITHKVGPLLPAQSNVSRKTVEEIVAALTKIALSEMNALYEKHEAPKLQEMKEKHILRKDTENTFLMVMCLLLVYTYLVTQFISAGVFNNRPIAGTAAFALSTFVPISSLMVFTFKTYSYLTEDCLILSGAWNEVMHFIKNPTKKPTPDNLLHLASALLIMQRIKEHQKQPEGMDPEHNAFHQFMLDFCSCISEKSLIMSSFAGPLFISKDTSPHLNATIHALVGLVAVHGEDFFSLAFKNEVPEIKIMSMTDEARIQLMKTKIEAIDSLSQKSKFATKDKYSIIALADELFLIYHIGSARSKHPFFKEFAQTHRDFLKHSEDKLSTDSPESFVVRSKQFSITLKEKEGLGLHTLESIVHSYKPTVDAGAQPSVKPTNTKGVI